MAKGKPNPFAIKAGPKSKPVKEPTTIGKGAKPNPFAYSKLKK